MFCISASLFLPLKTSLHGRLEELIFLSCSGRAPGNPVTSGVNYTYWRLNPTVCGVDRSLPCAASMLAAAQHFRTPYPSEYWLGLSTVGNVLLRTTNIKPLCLVFVFRSTFSRIT